MILYKIENGIGIYWIVAEHSTEAEEKLIKYLRESDYGFEDSRKAKVITPIAESASDKRFITNKFLVL